MGKRLIVGLSAVLAGLIVAYLAVRAPRTSGLAGSVAEAEPTNASRRPLAIVERDRFAPSERSPVWPPAPVVAAPVPTPGAERVDSGVDPDQARAERDAQIQALRASGAEDGHLIDAVRTLGRRWEGMVPGGVTSVTVGSWACFQAGCFVTVHHRAEESIGELSSKILESGEWQSWTGTKMRSAPIHLPDGSLEVSWFVFPPQDAAATD